MNAEVDFSELSAYGDNLMEMAKKYPIAVQVMMEDSTKEWTKDCNKRLKAVKQTSVKKHKIESSWKHQQFFSNGAMGMVDISNHAPHFHLIENGHVAYDFHGQAVGFTAGYHMAEQTREEWGATKWQDKVTVLLDDLVKRSGLQ